MKRTEELKLFRKTNAYRQIKAYCAGGNTARFRRKQVERISRMALNNMRDYWVEELLQRVLENQENMVVDLFRWGASPQGEDFWRIIDDHLPE